MPALVSSIELSSPSAASNRQRLQEMLNAIAVATAEANAGGGERAVDRHRQRGKLLPRVRIELLLDPDAPFLEFSTLAAAGTQFAVGASVVTGIGVIRDVEAVVIANDPTVRGGAQNPFTLRKILRALEIARLNRLPVVTLVESGGADLPTQSDIFIPGGVMFAELSRLSAAGVPTVSVVFGNATAGGAYMPAMCDYTILVRDRARVFLGGPPLVKMATGEDADEEDLGGAVMHGRTSGLADYVATDEAAALAQAREVFGRINWRKLGPGPSGVAREPRYDPGELLGIAPADLREPVDPREILARVVDDSQFDEFKPMYGPSLVTGWASIHGFPVGVLANHRGVLFNEEAEKSAQFIQLANRTEVPLVFLQNTTGYMVGRDYEHRGIVKAGAQMVNAVSNSKVPHITINFGGSYGAGNYGMCGRSFGPRFLFAWPNAKSAVMGPAQLAGVLSIVARQGAAAAGRPFDEERDAENRARVEDQIERESLAEFVTARVYDDGIIDPRDTRTVLAICLSAVDNNVVEGAGSFGVFRM